MFIHTYRYRRALKEKHVLLHMIIWHTYTLYLLIERDEAEGGVAVFAFKIQHALLPVHETSRQGPLVARLNAIVVEVVAFVDYTVVSLAKQLKRVGDPVAHVALHEDGYEGLGWEPIVERNMTDLAEVGNEHAIRVGPQMARAALREAQYVAALFCGQRILGLLAYGNRRHYIRHMMHWQ